MCSTWIRLPNSRAIFTSRCVARSAAVSSRHTGCERGSPSMRDRKSTRLNSSHLVNSYALFCLKKKTEHRFDREIGGEVGQATEIAAGESLRGAHRLRRRHCVGRSVEARL